ncbi:MAG: hypothetical protein ACM3ML_11045 [Micromonosporaceae bacterium]
MPGQKWACSSSPRTKDPHRTDAGASAPCGCDDGGSLPGCRADLPPGRPAAEVAPVALASTFVTSLGGVLTFTLLSIHKGPIAPYWPTGIALGIGG